MRHRISSNRRFYSNIRTGQSTDAVRPLSKRTWIRNSVRGHKAPKIGWGISGIPYVPGTLCPWKLVFLELWFPEPWRNPQRILEPWVSGTETRWFIATLSPPSAIARWPGPFGPGTLVSLQIVFWDPLRSMNLGTTHGVYPTPGLFPEPQNLARTLTLSLSGNCGIIQEVYPNCGSASVVVLGTLSEPSVAGTLPESWFPKLWVCRMSQNWCSGDSRTLAQSRLWLLETMVKVPGTLSKAKCARNLPGTLTSRNPKGSQNPLFPEPYLKVWFAEPWVPGTLPRTLVPRTLRSRNLAPNPGSRNRFSEPWFPEPAKRGGRVEQCPGAPRRLCWLRPQSILLLGKKRRNCCYLQCFCGVRSRNHCNLQYFFNQRQKTPVFAIFSFSP